MNRARRSIFFALAIALSLLSEIPAQAMVIDLLGEVAKPIIGSAQEKAKGLQRFLWLQPYFGYAWGKGDRKAVQSGVIVSNDTSLKIDGLMFGARGGFKIFDTFRIGLDWTRQLADREDIVNSTRQKTSSNNSMWGVTGGLDLPYTPFQGFVTRYFGADLPSDVKVGGTGWGYGISFVLKSPFLLMLESRTLNYSSDPTAAGVKVDRQITQYYLGLSFFLL